MSDQLTQLKALKTAWEGCTRCPLHETRTKIVFADGSPHAPIMIISAVPGEKENASGVPFKGPAGKILNGLVRWANADFGEVHLTTLCCCWPGESRVPTKLEIAACSPRLMRQIEIVDPDIIIAAGATASIVLTGNPKISVMKDRGTIVDAKFQGQLGEYVIPVMVTIDPANLLMNPDLSASGTLTMTRKDYITAFEIVDTYRQKTLGIPPKDRRIHERDQQEKA